MIADVLKHGPCGWQRQSGQPHVESSPPRFKPEQQVFILAYTPNTAPSKAVREAARASLTETFAKIDRYAEAHGITSEEADAALDEAMQQVRPRDR